MTKSEIFKAAHKMTKETIRKGDSYSATFGLCLAFIYANKKENNFVKFSSLSSRFQEAINKIIYATDKKDSHLISDKVFSEILIKEIEGNIWSAFVYNNKKYCAVYLESNQVHLSEDVENDYEAVKSNF